MVKSSRKTNKSTPRNSTKPKILLFLSVIAICVLQWDLPKEWKVLKHKVDLILTVNKEQAQSLCISACYDSFSRASEDSVEGVSTWLGVAERADAVVGSAFLLGLYDQLTCSHLTKLDRCFSHCEQTEMLQLIHSTTKSMQFICQTRHKDFQSLKPCFASAGPAVIRKCSKCASQRLEELSSRIISEPKAAMFTAFLNEGCSNYNCHLECQREIYNQYCDSPTDAYKFLLDFIRSDLRQLASASVGEFDLQTMEFPEKCMPVLDRVMTISKDESAAQKAQIRHEMSKIELSYWRLQEEKLKREMEVLKNRNKSQF